MLKNQACVGPAHRKAPLGLLQLADSYVFSLGLLLMAALVAGQAAYWLRLPRVTAYLLVGLLMGPHALGLVPGEHLHHFDPLQEMAMALVLFTMGCHFSLPFVRRILGRALRLSAGELGLTLVLVSGGMLMAGYAWQAALLFGVLALATAPATTILVLKENETEGPVTERAMVLVAFNNLAAVVAFEIILVGVLFASDTGAISPAEQLIELAWDLSVSLVLGLSGGLVISYASGLLARSAWLVMLVAMATLLLGVCEAFGEIPYLLAFLAMGATVANASERAEEIQDELAQITGLLCVVFFVIHGAELNVGALIAAGVPAAVYIGTRSLGKYAGIYLAAGRAANPDVRKWLGAVLLAQAGAALALSDIAVERAPELGAQLKAIIVGTVAFFEIVGPLLIRHAMLAVGEVPLDKAIRHQSSTPWLELRRMWNRLLIAAGWDPWHARSAAELTVSDLMRRNFDAIPAAASFDELVSVLERSHDNVFPVVGSRGELVGVIRYDEMRTAVFDPNLGPLVFAADLAQPARNVLHPDDPISHVWRLVRDSPDDLWPVVAPGTPPELVGVVARRDLYRFFLRRSP